MPQSGLLPLIVLLPLLGAILSGALALLAAPRRQQVPEGVVTAISCAAPAAAFVCAVLAFLRLSQDPAHGALAFDGATWFAAGPLRVGFDFALDHLSAVMALVVTGVGTLIHVYSVGYMKGDKGYARFFAYLNLFTFAMLVLVLARNLPLMFLGWEGVGACSYFLIGFWFTNPDYVKAANKAFIVNRIGDFSFLLGVFALFWYASRLGVPTLDIPTLSGVHYTEAAAGLAALLLFGGAVGKSAQIPLYVWLPDAMAGPTPVSALIHAATMVTAGVYMVARMHFLYDAAPAAGLVVATIGILTALVAATIAVAQDDIKKVLAYSTVSQLGYMFVGVGVGAYATGIFHLVTHAFFKALLFLAAGSVIHGMSGEQDLWKMGGLWKKMPVTAWTMLVGVLAIAGIPPLSGFFSKDAILAEAFARGYWSIWLVGLFTAGLTAYYMGRMFFLAFWGEPRDTKGKAPLHEAHAPAGAGGSHHTPGEASHAHESPAVMTVPLVVLAIGSALAGFLNVAPAMGGGEAFSRWLEPVFAPVRASLLASGAEWGLAVVSVLVAVAGLALAWRRFGAVQPDPVHELPGTLYDLLAHKYYVDEFYDTTVVQPVVQGSAAAWQDVDEGVVDRGFLGLAGLYEDAASGLRMLQTGRARTYAGAMLGGAVLAFLVLVAVRGV